MLTDKEYMLYLDLETTGLDPKVNGIWQLGGIITIDGVEKDSFDFKFAPREDEVIDKIAREMGGFSSDEELRALPKTSNEAYRAFIAILEKHISKYDKTQKFTFCGYNVSFDDGFLREWFKKNHEKYYGSYISPYKIDVYSFTGMLRSMGKLKVENLKLETVAKHLGIEIIAHDALSDIRATYEIYQIIWDRVKTLDGTLLDWYNLVHETGAEK